MLGRDEQVVLHQIASEEQPMPLVVGQLLNQVLDLAGARLPQNLLVAKLRRLGAKFAPQLNLRGM